MKKWNKNTKIQKENEELNEILNGFLIFTDKNREKNSIRDAYNILNDYLDEIYPNLNNSSENKNLEDEIKNLKRKKFFFNFETHCKGIIFIKINKEFKNKINPLEICYKLFNDLLLNKNLISKNIHKLIPIEICCKAKFEIFKEKIKFLINKYFNNKNNKNKIKWKIEFRSRNNNSIIKNDYLNYTINLIEKDFYEVDYKNPEKVVFIEITNNLCCLSVLEKYFEFKCFNIQTVVKSEEEKEKEKLLLNENKNKNLNENNENLNENLNEINEFNENEEIDLI
jgi:tRNA acetyltransferase TAN1